MLAEVLRIDEKIKNKNWGKNFDSAFTGKNVHSAFVMVYNYAWVSYVQLFFFCVAFLSDCEGV